MPKLTVPVYDICSLRVDRLGEEDIMVDRLSRYLEAHGDLHFPHRHSFYHLVLFTEGAGTHTIDFRDFAVLPNQMYFMVPGQVHSWNFHGNPEGYILNFSRNFFHSFLLRPEYLEQFPFLTGLVETSVLILPDQTFEEVSKVFETMLKEEAQEQHNRLDMMRVLLLQVLLSANRALVPKSSKRLTDTKSVIARSFQALVEQHFRRLKLPKEYASLLYITPNHLNALCKEVVGSPAGEIIRERVLLEAKRLLTDAGLSISEVAYQLNFSDNSYFTKFFKKYTSLTPEEFRIRNITSG